MKLKTESWSTANLIEAIISISSILGGIYVLSPLLNLSVTLNGPSALVATLGSPLGIFIFGSVFILSGVLVIAGILTKNNWIARQGLMLSAVARLYAVIGVWLISGFLPFTWLANFTLFVVLCVLWLVRGRE